MSIAQQALAAQPASPGVPAAEAWTQPQPVPKGAPNVIVIMTDDVGFGSASAFGGPIPTPVLDRVAANGLRFNRFHTTAVCSPTRAALLTGRNHNAVGMGVVPEFASNRPGYNSIIPPSQPTIARVLGANGYATALIGKSHVTPMWELGPAGPFDQWPTGLGFDYFYGFLIGETDQFSPALHENTTPVPAPKSEGYILDRDLADHAIQWLRSHKNAAGGRPFFMYYAPGTAHTPLQAPRDWIEKFRGAFDMGWDRLRDETLKRQIAQGVVPRGTKLAPRPPGIPEWNSIPEQERRVYAREMEVYAAMLAYADDQIGRVLAELKALGEEENTLIFFIEGDNGASGEGGASGALNHVNVYNGLAEDKAWALDNIEKIGGPETSPHYAAGWAMAMNTPFPWMKQYASHLGGIRNGLVVSWPERIKDVGKVRNRYSHVVDILPTVLSAAGITLPANSGAAKLQLDGVDISGDFASPTREPSKRTQYYDMFGNAGIFKDGWFANTTPTSVPWNVALQQKAVPFAERKWELYDLDKDFSQTKDVAAANPEKLAELKALYLSEAQRNQVVPGIDFGKPGLWQKDRDEALTRTFFGPTSRFPAGLAPDVLNRSFSIRADIRVPAGGPNVNGVVVTQGGHAGGYSLYVEDGTPVFAYNGGAAGAFEIRSSTKLDATSKGLAVTFVSDGGARGKGGTIAFAIDGRPAGGGRLERTVPILLPGDDAFDIGSDSGTAVTGSYATPNAFTGQINRVDFSLGKRLMAGPPPSGTEPRAERPAK